ncbi:YceI family protein [Aquihabitans sp. G128]|uniref:YceI family protein n=1 Tax=Aquihabitans sp. G128 TaxID=2849779 RepID=UPI001C24449E|nr:YceI family protein [Aquihabitans sp. G128]QXC62839.1 YceI family protein [Aquihabitans sp. G128]
MTDTELTDDALPPAPPEAPKRSHKLRWASLSVVLLGVAVAGVVAWKQVKPIVDSRRYASVTDTVPTAPKLTAKPGETVYRIDPTHSSLTYAITETFVGKGESTATGVTHGIAGDLAINGGDLGKSRVGKIVVNVEQFRSDNNLRDARIRQDFLSSHQFPLATFATQDLQGLEGKLVEGQSKTFTMDGFVTLKGTSATASWDVTARLVDGKLTATATTTAKLSRFDAGPISIAGLVKTADDVKLTLKLTAVDPTTTDVATEVASAGRVSTSTATSPSFAKVVQPIIEANCASCHTTGQMADEHIPMDTAGEVQKISDGIKTVTQSGYMPPWPASDKGVPLSHVATLSSKDLDALAAWSDGGGKLDVPATTKITLAREAAELQPRDDLSLEIPKYLGSIDNTNDYRCFVLDPKITEDTYLTGYRFLADQVQELHHAQVFQVSDEQVQSSKAKDGKDGQPGWSCYGGPELRGRRPDRVPGQPRTRDAGFAGQANLVAGWVPGQSPVIFPEQSGVLLHPGDALVLQIHYHYADEPIADRSGLSLQLDPGGSKIKELRVVNPLGPVEIPCAPKDADEPLCDRDASIADNVTRFGRAGASNESGLLALCGHTPEELTKDFDGSVARSSCIAKVPQDGVIIGAMGHMHTLGKSIRLTLDPDQPSEKILLDIPNWSFDWQMNYGFEEPVRVKAGEQIRIDCAWDRSADPNRAPKYIVFAEGTEDEMCFGTYSLIPDEQRNG